MLRHVFNKKDIFRFFLNFVTFLVSLILKILISRREQRFGDGPIYYMKVRRKPEQVFVFRIPHAVSLCFHLLT